MTLVEEAVLSGWLVSPRWMLESVPSHQDAFAGIPTSIILRSI